MRLWRFAAFPWTLVAAVATSAPAWADDERKFTFMGFGDASFGVPLGPAANRQAQADFVNFGEGVTPPSVNRGFAATGIDFVVMAHPLENLLILGEVNLQAVRSQTSEIEFDAERLFVDYQVHRAFAIKAGLYFTPIGYFNRFLYSRALLMHSIQIPDTWEEDLNLVPTHTPGVSVHGQFNLDQGDHAINYELSVGNGRGRGPNMPVYARDENWMKQIAGHLEWEWMNLRFDEFRLGFSGWFDRVDTLSLPRLGESIHVRDPAATKVALREVGINPYLTVRSRWVAVLAEYVVSLQRDLKNNLAQNTYHYHGARLEVAGNIVKGKLHPYLRWDLSTLPDTNAATGGEDQGPYFGLRENDSVLRHVYVPNFHGVMAGLAYDPNRFLRLKGEYGYNFAGPRKRHSISLQLAFGF